MRGSSRAFKSTVFSPDAVVLQEPRVWAAAVCYVKSIGVVFAITVFRCNL
jgi:hypothetical protein